MRDQQVKSGVNSEGEAKAQEARAKRFRDEAAAFRRRVELTNKVAELTRPRGSDWAIPKDAVQELQRIGRELMEQTASPLEEEHHA